MSVLSSATFWLTFAAVLAASILVMIRHERAKRRGPTQRRGVQPNEQAKLIVTDIGPDGYNNKVTHAYHITTDPQAFADIFVPSGKKD